MALLLGAIEETIKELAVRHDSTLLEHFARLHAMRLDLRERLSADADNAIGERRSA